MSAYKNGALAFLLLLLFYGVTLSVVSGVNYATEQFFKFWPFIVSLALGFGIQAGLYTHLRKIALHGKGARGTITVTGTTSGLAMVSCCAHYAANLLPIIGTAGLVSIVAAYQTELFVLGIIFNAAGIVYISRQILLVKRKSCEHVHV